ncbi:DUF4191 domain-containing protein [Corynebacterium guaraldiae]|uniref:DUF4191 domain-containing protein n=1 Tax=Corynebacterium guaraldiae TaxID=3051103 RepID=A0ABY3CS81_9CORY|nr:MULTISPECIES: DUF4191 domain-containing protein [Corynebacterium]HCT9179378.1 DUF4191 domain-containing protein [Corynebacterium aurimucosum]MDK8898533.1 DUF4191 domain-containing protein [Corynebacterium sp. MSK004]OFL62262.1 hypothetical protein HMPREF2760_01740 [Corynebacterium sp. HMSC065D07]OFQ91298.1 hypothetical protein HMPREF2912_03265 [Corynebacterium sp. HMSC056E09]TRX48028.1 DUF4191 domain-containing protein [Corynebacterium guaraldiae]
MANDDKASLKEAKKQERAAKRAQRKQNWSQMWQAFNMQRKQDKALIPIMLAAFLGMGLLFFLIGTLFNGQWFMLILGLGIGAILAMFLFTRRLERDMYKKVEDQPGAAGWALEQQLRNTVGVVWKVKTGVAATRQQDLIHRVIGNSGVIFVVEGDRKRVGPTLNRLKKRVDRMAGGVPVYEVFVGNGEDEVPVSKLRSHIMKLPRNYNKNETYDNIRRIEAMDDLPGTTPGLPKGPMPRQAQNMAGMNRRMRRMQERKGGK